MREENHTQKNLNGTSNPAQSGTPARSGIPVLPDQEQIIVNYIQKNSQCTTSVIADLLNVKERRARGLLGNLVKKNILSKKGNARNTVYLAGLQFPKGE